MANFAEIDENNVVIRVLATSNDDPNGDEGYQWLIDNFGGRWIQTSYNANFRKNFAGIDYIYDEVADVFIPPKPFNSWILDEENYLWIPPKPYPDSNKFYSWNEEFGEWVEA